MNSVLIVSSSINDTLWIRQDIERLRISNINVVKSVMEARRILASHFYDLLIIDISVLDNDSVCFARDSLEVKANQILMLTDLDNVDKFEENLEKYGIFTLGVPCSHDMLYGCLKMIEAAFNRMHMAQLDNENLRKKIEDLKTIYQAKSLLMEKCHCTEEEAHKLIERSAMENRVTKIEISEKIIEKYYR